MDISDAELLARLPINALTAMQWPDAEFQRLMVLKRKGLVRMRADGEDLLVYYRVESP